MQYLHIITTRFLSVPTNNDKQILITGFRLVIFYVPYFLTHTSVVSSPYSLSQPIEDTIIFEHCFKMKKRFIKQKEHTKFLFSDLFFSTNKLFGLIFRSSSLLAKMVTGSTPSLCQSWMVARDGVRLLWFMTSTQQKRLNHTTR